MILFFWISVFIVFYTYLGYGILLYLIVKIKETRHKQKVTDSKEDYPPTTLMIAAFNEQDIIKQKMINCDELDYPKDKLNIYWVTDGSNDETNNLLSKYENVKVFFKPERLGKTAALNRAIKFVETQTVIFTDANTMLNKEAIKEIIKKFRNPKVGCVAGEKRINIPKQANAASNESFYWKYESKLKDLDDRLYSTIGAAGELYAIRTHLFKIMPNDTLLDDFILSMEIAANGYKIAYCSTAYAVEPPSLNIKEEGKRKVRIAAGGLQSIIRIKKLLNIFKYKTLSFQYISHRVLRWSITPILLFTLPFVNIFITIKNPYNYFYLITLILQIVFYALAFAGFLQQRKNIKNKILYIPYYFLFMNINVIKGFFYLYNRQGNTSGAWEKAKRL